MGSSMPAVDLPHITDLGAVPTGDMPGDKVQIGPAHDAKARAIFPRLWELLQPRLAQPRHHRRGDRLHRGDVGHHQRRR
mgnify:CR=1 FL=1